MNGLACFTRTAPTGFTMWLREQAHVFDWGTLKWCQAYASPPNGCYDAETIALDEFGHVEGLNHHGNYADDRTTSTPWSRPISRTKPASGWNMHAFGRCDVASLQLQYDMQSWSAKYSTCLDLATDLALSASSTAINLGGSTTLTATLKVVDYDSYLRLGGNPITGRTVTLQRRPAGASTWASVGTMAVGAAGGTYVTTVAPRADADYRAVFGTPSNEGINGDTSPTISVLSVQSMRVDPLARRRASTRRASEREGGTAMRPGVMRTGAPALLAIVVVGIIVATCDSAGRNGSAGGSTGAPMSPGPTAEPTGDSGARDRHPGRDRRPRPIPRRPAAPAHRPPPACRPRRRWRPMVAIPRSDSWARTPGSMADPTARGCPGPRSRWARVEPLTVAIGGGVAVADWSARRVTAGRTDGNGAIALGEAAGPPVAFTAPAAGTWSLQVTVRFANDLGSAAYYWRLTVR